VRLLLALAVLAALASSQDDDHDEFGFPITFDADVITRNDVVRSAGVDSEEQLGSMRNERDKFLMERLLEKVAEIYDLQITTREIDDWIARDIARFDSEAKFYDSLLQEGLTLELKKEEIRRKLIEGHLHQLFQLGFLARGHKLLPWDPNPTPREIKIAYENDPMRRNAGVDVKWKDLLIDIPAKDRKKIQGKRLFDPDITEEWVENEIKKRVEPLVAKVKERLKAGKSLDEIGLELNLKVAEKVRSFPREIQKDAAKAFLQQAQKGQTSAPVPLPHARWVVLHVVQIHRAGDTTLDDKRVVAAYKGRIAQLKRRKAEFTLRLRALDKADLRPERVRRDLRQLILSELRQARRGLRELGIH
jgi:hypothetical protein